jgi:hypothetical protein
MKTKTNDLKKLIEMRNLRNMAIKHMEHLNGVISRVVKGVNDMAVVETCITVSKQFEKKAVEAEAIYKKIPLKRRKYVEDLYNFFSGYGAGLCRKGGVYSGETKFEVLFNTLVPACAYTITSYGEKYTKSSKYNKTNALHKIYFNHEGLVILYDNQELLQMVAGLGVNLLSLKENGEAVFFKVNNKQITYFKGWFAFDTSTGLAALSQSSFEDAKLVYLRKLKIYSSCLMKD